MLVGTNLNRKGGGDQERERAPTPLIEASRLERKERGRTRPLPDGLGMEATPKFDGGWTAAPARLLRSALPESQKAKRRQLVGSLTRKKRGAKNSRRDPVISAATFSGPGRALSIEEDEWASWA
ncbi:hypothetical protein SAY86_024683 [Trapa natans]|uniref:Uncharacterized protein n=1 Tax=Trapa natans TaxID=22666 RepID=A0AAN7LZM9_TRANT|nr:hypothetical protein SAY86_024683 [Trapa natans]